MSDLIEWLPTSENINALPEPIRTYIAALETNCDPAGMVRENAILRHDNAEFETRLAEQSAVVLDDERAAFEAEWKRAGWGDADTKKQCFHFWQARAASPQTKDKP